MVKYYGAVMFLITALIPLSLPFLLRTPKFLGSNSGGSDSRIRRRTSKNSLPSPSSSNSTAPPSSSSDGYTMYTDPKTGVTSRVFDALVEYPSTFTIKVVGLNVNGFASEIENIINEVARVDGVKVKVNGKWCSLTCRVWVRSGEELYRVYEVVGEDERVKFKF